MDIRILHRLALGSLAIGSLSTCGENGPSNDKSHPSLVQVDSVEVLGRPYGVAISREGRSYVTLLDLNSVVTDSVLPADAFASPIAVGLTPPHVVFNPAGFRAYVTNQTGQSMSVIDVAENTVLTTVPLTADGFNLVTSADGQKVFVSVATGQVYVVDAGTNQIVDSIILGPAVNGFARHPRKKLIHISSRDAGTVSEVSTTSNQVARTLLTGGAPQRLAVTPNGRELLIANETLGLDIWNLETGVRDTTVGMAAYGLALSPDGEKVYVTSGPGGIITIVNRADRSVDTTLTVGGITRNVAFDAKGKTAIITNEADFVTVVH
jgi:YVTN family beta-propeller protein